MDSADRRSRVLRRGAEDDRVDFAGEELAVAVVLGVVLMVAFSLSVLLGVGVGGIYPSLTNCDAGPRGVNVDGLDMGRMLTSCC